MVCEEINKLSAFKYGMAQKQYILSLLPIAGVMETGSYLPTYHTIYRSKAQNIRDEKVQCVEDVRMKGMSCEYL